MPSISRKAQAAQDAARHRDGEFGTQPHAESGLVDMPDGFQEPDVLPVTTDLVAGGSVYAPYDPFNVRAVPTPAVARRAVEAPMTPWDRFRSGFSTVRVIAASSNPVALVRGMRIRNAYLRGANLAFVERNRCVMPRSDFRGANLQGAQLRASTLTNCDFRGADLRGVDFYNTDLSGSRFGGAFMEGTILQNAILTGCDVTETDLAGAFTYNAHMPDGWWLPEAGHARPSPATAALVPQAGAGPAPMPLITLAEFSNH